MQSGAKLKHMQVIYEPSDIVQVEDNIDAGVYAACTVELISPAGNGHWNVRFVDCVGGKTAPEYGLAEEYYFRP
jgi:hypothetical protein